MQEQTHSLTGDIRYYIDLLTPRAARGWAFSDANFRIQVEIWSDRDRLAETVANLSRADVAQAYGGAGSSLQSGFALDFTLPVGGLSAPVVVRLKLLDERGKTLRAIDAAQARFISDAGRSAIRSRTGEVPPSAFPRPIAVIILALWPDAPVGSYREEDQVQVAELLLELASQPMMDEFIPVLTYARYVREVWAHFEFVRRYFPRANERRSSSDKDYCCTPNSPEELFSIAHHLYVLKSFGVDGAFAEFGCYKGYSTAMLSYACRWLGIEMHVFDSFAGLPSSASRDYVEGEFAGSLAEVRSNVERFGSLEAVKFHEGYFAETLPSFAAPSLLSLWMDVDLAASATEVMSILENVEAAGAVFSHECEPQHFDDARIVPLTAGPNNVVPAILDAYARLGIPVQGRFVHGNTGAFWRQIGGLPVLNANALHHMINHL